MTTIVAAPGRVLSGFVQRWTVVVVAVLLWQLAAAQIGSPFFPTPVAIVGSGVDAWFSGPLSQGLLTDAAFNEIVPSVRRLLTGWLVAAVLGVAGGLLLGRSHAALAYVGPLLSFMRAIPPPALVPVFLVLFSIGPRMQLATIAFGCVWPILLNSADGARSVDGVKVETARAFRLPRAHWILEVVLPSALPKIFAGLRISLALALIMMVISELVGATDGIGHAMQLAQYEFDYTRLWAGIVLLGILGNLLNTALLAVERAVLGATRPPD